MPRYNPKDIEPKWQRSWADANIYAATDFDTSRPKYVMLTEFPYPSGDGLHIGHVREYTLADIIARHKRMHGYNVLYPMGYDAFGLPTENYAIKHKIAPQIATANNIANFEKQFSDLGLSFDWSRRINTTDPAYYKWTQWLFLQFFHKGLAYQKEVAINWCPHCKTGLSNEEVVNGRHERCDTLVEKKLLKQWLMKITEYADRLIEGLKAVDYPSRIADQQINWIGKSVGAEVDFGLAEDASYVLLHGYKGGPQQNFFPWLQAQLNISGRRVVVPELPHSDHPSVMEQVEYVEKTVPLNDATVLLGHSLGAPVALKVAERLPYQIKRLVLVCGFAQPGFLDGTRPFEDGFDWQFDFEKIKHNVEQIVILRAANDTAVPQERADYLAERLGATIIDFEAAGNHATGKVEPVVLEHVRPTIKVFTTRPDTLYGATFLVIAPEHPLAQKIPLAAQRSHVAMYIKAAQAKTDIERQNTEREKTGVFTGRYAFNPVSGEQVPIWIADYVLASYGTGAIMAVPAHDERDFAYAQKHGLPIKQVVMPVEVDMSNPPRAEFDTVRRETVIVYLRDKSSGKYALLNWHESLEGITTAIMGGIEAGQTAEEAARTEIAEEAGLSGVRIIEHSPWLTGAIYCAAHKQQNRLAVNTVLLAEVDNLESQVEVDEKERKQHTVEWVKQDEIVDKLPAPHRYGWEHLQHVQAITRDGELINSGGYDGLPTTEARKKIVADLAAKGLAQEKVNYKLRDWIFSRQHYWGEPIPIIHCPKDGAVPVPEDQLPVTLPQVEHYEPTDSGESPLAAMTDWVNTTCPVCGGPAQRETDTMPNWAGSSWYYLRYFDAHNDERFAAKDKLNYWQNVDLYLGGMEHTTLHLLYSRFWHQFLYDQGLVPTPEPYQARRGQGIILAADGSKMSKSKGNVINPNDVIASGYGADALRLAIAFLAPYDQTTPWNPESVAGTYRFLHRIWVLTQDFIAAELSDVRKHPTDEPLVRLTHRTVKKVSEDIGHLDFNTAIAAMMEMTNQLYKLKTQDKFASEQWRIAINTLLLLLAPYAPHMAEELWHQLGNETSIHLSKWPKYDERHLTEATVSLAVQVNGKLRDTIKLDPNTDQAAAEAHARASSNVRAHLTDKSIVKTIYVPGKILNFVVK